MTSVRYINGKEIRHRKIDLRLMSVEGADWFVDRLEDLCYGGCKIINALDVWIEKVELRLNENIMFDNKIINEHTLQNVVISVQKINDECNIESGKLIQGIR